MTYSGEFNSVNLSTVKIPIITNNLSIGTLNGKMYYYSSTNNIYYIAPSDGTTYASNTVSPLNWLINSAASSTSVMSNVSSIIPKAIGNYFYAFDALNARIYKASINSPSTWVDTNINYNTSSTAAPISYVDGSKVWLFGGNLNTGNVAQKSIYSANIGTPTAFVSTGTQLPAGRSQGSAASYGDTYVAVVGSLIYMYTGFGGGSIFTAQTSNPAVWTDSTVSLPSTQFSGVEGKLAGVYSDNTNVYFFYYYSFGASSAIQVLKSTTGNPTTVSATPISTINIAFAPSFLSVIPVNGNMYLITDSAIYRSALTNLVIWQQLYRGGTNGSGNIMYTPIKGTHLVLDKPNNKIYAVGGFQNASNNGVPSTIVQSANLSNPLEWINETSFAEAIGGGEIVKTRGTFNIIAGRISKMYTSSISSPTTWTITTTIVPSLKGKCVVVGSHLFLLGGEDAGVNPVNTLYRASVDVDNLDNINNDWAQQGGTLPVALARFTLIKSGSYIYLIGGYTGTAASPVYNYNIYRIKDRSLNNLISAWKVVGKIINPFIDASVIIINNYAYILGGVSSIPFNLVGIPSTMVYSISMIDLSNGICNVVEENNGMDFGFSEAAATCINDQVFFFGTKNYTAQGLPDSTKGISRTVSSSIHFPIQPNFPENNQSIPVMDRAGTIGSYSSFQKTGILPWLTIDSTIK